VLLDELADHLQMPELFGGDIEEHVPDRLVVLMKGLGKVSQRCGQLAGGAAELLEEFLRKHRIRSSDLDLVQWLANVNEHVFLRRCAG